MTIPDSPLKRQKLVILGGTSGIGAAVAYAAAARGAEVVLASRRLPHAREKNDALRLMQADARRVTCWRWRRASSPAARSTSTATATPCCNGG